MLACDYCDGWFHYECVAMRPCASVENSTYMCESCCKQRGTVRHTSDSAEEGFGRGATETGPLNDRRRATLSRCACTCEYGVQSCQRDWAKRRGETAA